MKTRLHCNNIRNQRITALALAIIGTIGFANAATDFCLKTAQAALDACQNAAESEHAIALGKCNNLADANARASCQQQAATDLQAARQSCREQLTVRQNACQKFGPSPYDPVIDPANFVREVTNPYFPLPPGRTLVYEGQTVDGFEHTDFIITHRTKVIQGVTCIEVHDRVFLDGILAEDTLDWFAQDKQGNVWYFGENTGELADGRFVTLAGTFTAGVNGDKPGIIQEANSAVGDFYRQEFSLGNAEDFAQVIALNANVKVPAGTFHNCLRTEETTPLEPALLEDKFYAAGVGNVLTLDLRTGDKRKLIKVINN